MSANDKNKGKGEYIPVSTKVTLKDLAEHGIYRPARTSDKKVVAQNVAIGASIVGGTAATTVGVIAAGTSATVAISAAGAAIGSVAGGVVGSGVGLATGGVGMAATVPFAAAGAAIGGWAGGQHSLLLASEQLQRGQSPLLLAAAASRSAVQRLHSISLQNPEQQKTKYRNCLMKKIEISAAIAACLLLAACGGPESDARKAVLGSLKDPDSAKFGKFTLVNEKNACLTVNARNSMGGYTGDQQAWLIKRENAWVVLFIDKGSHEQCIDITKETSEKYRNAQPDAPRDAAR